MVISSTMMKGKFLVLPVPPRPVKLMRTCRWKPILDNIEARFDAYLDQENRVNRTKMNDNRIHACLYFIEPTGHSYAPSSIFSRSSSHEILLDSNQ